MLDEGEGCDDPVVYAEVNARFHDIIKTGARNAMLAATLEDMNLRTLSWRAANFHEDSGRLAASKAEHRAIAEAILAHDAETTRRQMRSHVAAAFMALSDTLSRRG